MRNIERCECGGFFMIEDSRPLLGGIARHRRRKCTYCGKSIYTIEIETLDGLSRTERKLKKYVKEQNKQDGNTACLPEEACQERGKNRTE